MAEFLELQLLGLRLSLLSKQLFRINAVAYQLIKTALTSMLLMIWLDKVLLIQEKEVS